METNAPAKKNNNLIVILLAVIIVLLIAVLAVFLLKDDGGSSAQSADPSQGLQYASEGVTVIDDQNALQAAVDEMQEGRKSMSLWYKYSAASDDGETFTCMLGNNKRNTRDMYIQIFADDAFTDQLFLSGLIRPGEAFESITLEHSLEPGAHEVYCAFTQVEEDLQTIYNQTIVTLQFVVN